MILNRIEQLQIFKNRDKFSIEAWNYRGLNPPSEATLKRLFNEFENVVEELLTALRLNGSEAPIKCILESSLNKLNTEAYDTEEKEFICDLYYELSTIVGLEFRETLSIWLYGHGLTDVHNEANVVIFETYSCICSSCGEALKAIVTSREEGTPEMDWIIAQCNKCSELNLFDLGSEIKELRFENCKLVKTIPRKDFPLQKVESHLRELRNAPHN